MKKLLVVGGGSGTFTILSGLKRYPFELSVVVSMMDSGGSSGRLRDQFGVLPPGDFRQCLVALSSSPELWRKLFLFRFDSGDLDGHNFGNIFLTALEKISDNYAQVVEFASETLSTTGKVIPVTFDSSHLTAKYDDGTILDSEDLIEKSIAKRQIERLYLVTDVKVNPLAIDAALSADFIVLGPGDLYTSIIPNLLVRGFSEAIQRSKAKILYVVNLMTKLGQTTDFGAARHIQELEKYLGRSVDIILLNIGEISAESKTKYLEEGGYLVKDDLLDDPRVYRANLISQIPPAVSKSDKTSRSLVRHDGEKLAEIIQSISNSNRKLSDDVKDVIREAKSALLS